MGFLYFIVSRHRLLLKKEKEKIEKIKGRKKWIN